MNVVSYMLILFVMGHGGTLVPLPDHKQHQGTIKTKTECQAIAKIIERESDNYIRALCVTAELEK